LLTLEQTTALVFTTAQDPKVTADRAFNGFGTNFENSPEPIYGAQFLPRKFKIGRFGASTPDVAQRRLASSLACLSCYW
jgi:hypothetical protein